MTAASADVAQTDLFRQRDHAIVVNGIRSVADETGTAIGRAAAVIRECVAIRSGRRELEIQQAMRTLGKKIATLEGAIRSRF
jgi:hypothetical protein